MTKKQIDYSNTIIYKLCSLDPSVVEEYVGYTTNFICRKNCHKNKCHHKNGRDYNLKVYQYIRATGGWSNWNMVMIEKFPCSGILEAKQREQFYISNLHSSLNSISSISTRTKQEISHTYYTENKTKLQTSSKAYRGLHQNELKEYCKIYYINNKEQQSKPVTCECGSLFRIDGQLRHTKSIKHQQYILSVK